MEILLNNVVPARTCAAGVALGNVSILTRWYCQYQPVMSRPYFVMASRQSFEASGASSDRESSVLSTIELSSSGTSTLQDPSSTSRNTRKRKATANTWTHARAPQNSEPIRCARKNEKIYYCKHCMDPTYSTTVSTTFRHHLLRVHGIELEAN